MHPVGGISVSRGAARCVECRAAYRDCDLYLDGPGRATLGGCCALCAMTDGHTHTVCGQPLGLLGLSRCTLPAGHRVDVPHDAAAHVRLA